MKCNFNFCIMPECNLDTNLVETLVPPEIIDNTCGYNHQFGYGDIINIMKLEIMQNKFALGVLDIDKNVSYRDFLLLIEKQLSSQNVINLYKHQHRNHYLICHTPIERLILNEAKSVNISLADYDLPSTLKRYNDENQNWIYGLKDVKGTSKHDKRFKDLFNELLKRNSIGIKLISEWIKYLKNHPDDADINELKKLS